MYAGRMTTTLLDRATVEFINSEADRIVRENPPSRVVLTVFLFSFFAVSWVVGRTWFHLAKLVPLVVLSCRSGYRKGGKVPVELKKPPAAQ
jgi:hypothetical protein